jgi:hypothetical protein
VKEITSLILGQDFDSINQIYENKDHEPVLKVWIASVAIKAISRGDVTSAIPGILKIS